MTFSYTTNDDGKVEYIGRKKLVSGTFENDSTIADGYINTGLRRIDVFQTQGYAEGNTAPAASYPKATSFPVDAEGITVRAGANTTGIWFAIGE